MILDMSAAKRLNTPNQVFRACGSEVPAWCLLGPSALRQPMESRRFGSLRATVSNALLLAALLLSFAGCSSLQSDTAARPTPLPPADTTSAPILASVPKQPEAPSKPVSPAVQQPQRISEPKPPPATASKGAEKLVAPSALLLARAREKTTVKPEPVQPKPPVNADSGAVTDAPVKELIFKGPPPQPRTRLSAKKVLVWFGLGAGVVVVAIVGRLCLVRRAEPSQVSNDKKEDLIDAPGLLLKESVNLPQQTLAAKES